MQNKAIVLGSLCYCANPNGLITQTFLVPQLIANRSVMLVLRLTKVEASLVAGCALILPPWQNLTGKSRSPPPTQSIGLGGVVTVFVTWVRPTPKQLRFSPIP